MNDNYEEFEEFEEEEAGEDLEIILYGIKSCEKIRKFFNLFEKFGVEFTFVDLLKTPPSREKVSEWTEFYGELPINTRGASYKKIKKFFDKYDEKKKLDTALKNVALFERPILEHQGEVVCIGGRPERIFKELFL